MSVTLTTIRYLQAEGFPAEKILVLVAQLEELAAVEAPRSSAAIRQARYRAARKAALAADDVTRDVTRDVTTPALNDTGSNSKPSEGNLNPPPYSPPAKAKTKASGRPDYEPEFGLVWDEFPRHANASKSEAYRLWKRLDPEDREGCLSGAMAYAEYLSGERRKRPDFPGLHLATFINQRRWEAHLEAAE